MDKQLIYIAVGVAAFILLMVGIGFMETGGGGKPQIVNPELLKLEIDKAKGD
ncbi:hypothetical protein NONS58_27400 [Nitrosococcus oceani]|nr:hypothetical protein NONS58_27400 [Nitrosococcus oceani]